MRFSTSLKVSFARGSSNTLPLSNQGRSRMEDPSIEYTDKQRWFALTKINTLSALSQIVQIGTVTPLLSLSLEQRGVEPAKIGVIVSASWLAILLLYKWVPRLLAHLGLVNTNILSATLTSAALIGMT